MSHFESYIKVCHGGFEYLVVLAACARNYLLVRSPEMPYSDAGLTAFTLSRPPSSSFPIRMIGGVISVAPSTPRGLGGKYDVLDTSTMVSITGTM
jgi:hypothetical protein